MRFRSKPVEIEAVQWTGSNYAEVSAFVGFTIGSVEAFIGSAHTADLGVLWVTKSKRWITVEPGTWVMAEPDGSGFYPCVDDVFQARWEPVGDVGSIDARHLRHYRACPKVCLADSSECCDPACPCHLAEVQHGR